MSENCMKSNIFYNENIYENTAEIPIDAEFTMPDFCPDISKLLKCKATARVSSKTVNGNNINIDGTVTVNILYSNDESMIYSYEYHYPFNKVFNFEDSLEECSVNCDIKCEYINCRAISGRKIEIHGAATLMVCVSRKNKTEIVSDIDDKFIEINRQFLPATVQTGNNDKYVIIEEELEIGNGQPPIRSILRYDAKCCVNEVKIINDKVIVKGEIFIPVLYCSDTDCSLQTVKCKIPFSQIVEIPGINEDCKCNTKVNIAYIELKPRITPNGNANSILVNIKLLISCEAVCENDLSVITDVYSKKNLLNVTRKNVQIKRIVKNISDIHNLKYDTELTEEIKTVVDLWCDIREVHTKINDKKICFFGDLVIGVIYTNNDNMPMFCERVFDFTYESTIEEENIMCSPQLEITSISYFLTGNSTIEFRIDMNVNAAIYCNKEMPLITDFAVLDKKDKVNNFSMLIYYSSAGESIWDIAKKYNSAKDEIKKINSLSDDEIKESKMLLIPVN